MPAGSHRVLWVTENHPPQRGGMAQSSDRIVRGLRGAGVRIDVAHLSRSAGRPRIERTESGHDITAPIEDDHEHALRQLWNQILRVQAGPALDEPAATIDAPYTHVVAFGGTLPLLAAPTYAAWLHAPLLTLVRGNDFDTGIFSLRRHDVVLAALQASSAVSCVAASTVAQVQALVPDGRVRWITNGIDVERWSLLPSEADHAAAWRRTDTPDGSMTIGLIGHLKRKKGVVFFLQCLLDTGHAARTHVLLVGETDEATERWLDDHADALSWSVLPFLDRFELLRWYAACDVVALPSFYDGLPNVALEAAALGIPLLASDAGGLADLVVDGQTGFTFGAFDEASCRLAIDRAVRATDGDRARLGRAGQERVTKEFDAAAETRSYLALLDETTTT